MHAPAYHCPACGGPQRHSGPGQCDFCGAVRVPLGVPDPRTAQRCPECAALIAGDHRFCPKCGAAQGEAPPPLHEHGDVPCPHCEQSMAVWTLDPRLSGASSYRGSGPMIHGCQHCGGAWVDRSTLNAMIEEARTNAPNVDPRTIPRKTMAMPDVVFYRPCPRCGERMNRRNFGRYSGIVVDECAPCGTFFDAGELEGVIEFVRAGGLGLAKIRDDEDTVREAAQRRQVAAVQMTQERHHGSWTYDTNSGEFELIVGFLRWLGQWVRRVATDLSRQRPRR